MTRLRTWIRQEAPAAAFPAALLAGLAIGAGWIADHVLTPVTTRHIQFIDAMEKATNANALVLNHLATELQEIKRNPQTETHSRIDDTLNDTRDQP